MSRPPVFDPWNPYDMDAVEIATTNLPTETEEDDE